MKEYNRYAEEELRKDPETKKDIIKHDIIYEFFKEDIKKYNNKEFFYDAVIPVFREIMNRHLKIRSFLIFLLLWQKQIYIHLKSIKIL